MVEVIFNKFRNAFLERSSIDVVLFKSSFKYEVIPDYLSGLVMIPWTWDTVTFSEMYGLNVPVFIPSKELDQKGTDNIQILMRVTKIMYFVVCCIMCFSSRYMVAVMTANCVIANWRFMDTRPEYAGINGSDGNCSYVSLGEVEHQRLGLHPKTILPRCIQSCNPEHFAVWWDQANAATRKFVTNFDSFSDLFSMFKDRQHAVQVLSTIAKNMRNERQAALDYNRDWHRNVLGHLLHPERVCSVEAYEKKVNQNIHNAGRRPFETLSVDGFLQNLGRPIH